MGDDSWGDEEPEAQGVDGDLLEPAEVTLKKNGEVVGEYGQGEHGFRGEELATDEGAQAETAGEFFDDVLTIGALVVEAPDLQWGCAGGQIGHQRLEQVARHIQEHFAAAASLFFRAAADQNQSAGALPMDGLILDIRDLCSINFRGLPKAVPTQQMFDRLAQLGDHHVA